MHSPKKDLHKTLRTSSKTNSCTAINYFSPTRISQLKPITKTVCSHFGWHWAFAWWISHSQCSHSPSINAFSGLHTFDAKIGYKRVQSHARLEVRSHGQQLAVINPQSHASSALLSAAMNLFLAIYNRSGIEFRRHSKHYLASWAREMDVRFVRLFLIDWVATGVDPRILTLVCGKSRR